MEISKAGIDTSTPSNGPPATLDTTPPTDAGATAGGPKATGTGCPPTADSWVVSGVTSATAGTVAGSVGAGVLAPDSPK